MSSKGGPRAKGTDGGDFSHREKVASHYQISSKNKKKLKFAIAFHFLSFLYIILKLSTEILQFFDISLKQYLNVTLPNPALWEPMWLTSIIYILPALYAMKKNNLTAMKIYAYGTLLCGIVPLLVGIGYHSTEFKTFLLSEKGSINVEKFYGIPIVLISAIFISITFLIHSLSIMSAVNLIRAWTPKSGKKKA